jgi:oligosaccharyltransferase complex subunit alpha (ribophorin I)
LEEHVVSITAVASTT